MTDQDLDAISVGTSVDATAAEGGHSAGTSLALAVLATGIAVIALVLAISSRVEVEQQERRMDRLDDQYEALGRQRSFLRVVPHVEGLDLDSAQRVVTAAGLTAVVDPSTPPGSFSTVVRQEPSPGTEISRGMRVVLYLHD